MLEFSLAPFAAAIGVALSWSRSAASFDPAAIPIGVGASATAAALWYGWGMLLANPARAPPAATSRRL